MKFASLAVPQLRPDVLQGVSPLFFSEWKDLNPDFSQMLKVRMKRVYDFFRLLIHIELLKKGYYFI
jgi:hypothetical protein